MSGSVCHYQKIITKKIKLSSKYKSSWSIRAVALSKSSLHAKLSDVMKFEELDLLGEPKVTVENYSE